MEYFNNINNIDGNIKPIIPLNLFQTWYTKNLPKNMRDCVNSLILDNPEFTHYLYDDNECKNFIKDNFDQSVLEAYERLIPGAYKADLWRYCILYKKGGIYLDIKYRCVNGFKLINLTNKEHFVRDIDNSGKGIYNAFMICKPGNKKCLECINAIVSNVKNRYYGSGPFDITGPLLLLSFFSEQELNNIELKHSLIKNHTSNSNNYFIEYNNFQILSAYPEYRTELKQFLPNKHYMELWFNRSIYN